MSADIFVAIVLTHYRVNKKIYCSILQFIDKTLAKFELTDAHLVLIPLLKGTVEKTTMADNFFREVVECLMYAALTVRIEYSEGCTLSWLAKWLNISKTLAGTIGKLQYVY